MLPGLALLASAALAAPPVDSDAVFPLLVYGEWSATPGDWAEYRLQVPQGGPARVVRVAVAGESTQDGQRLIQIEVKTEKPDPSLLVLWVAPGDAQGPEVRRVALWLKPNPAIGAPVEPPARPHAARGAQDAEGKEALQAGGRRFQARRLDYRHTQGRARVWLSREVPVFGVVKLALPGETWTYLRHGTGAASELTVVPMAPPRLRRPE